MAKASKDCGIRNTTFVGVVLLYITALPSIVH